MGKIPLWRFKIKNKMIRIELKTFALGLILIFILSVIYGAYKLHKAVH